MMLAHTKIQNADIAICQCVHKVCPVLVTRVYNTIWQNTRKKL